MTRRLLVAGALLTACAREGGPTVTSGFAFAPVAGAPMAAYFTVVNPARTADTLVSVTSPLGAAAVHRQMEMTGMVHMEAAGPIAIRAGDSLVLAPGDRHVMLDLTGTAPAAGDTLALTLHFARAGDVTARLPVRAYGDAP
jgi:copper(I)-binding protein